MSEEERMDKITGMECHEERSEWNVASSSSMPTSSTLKKSKCADQIDAVNCATVMHVDSDMTMKEIHSNGINGNDIRQKTNNCDKMGNITTDNIRDECSNNAIVTPHISPVNSSNVNSESMDEDPIDVNSSSLSPSSLIHNNSHVNANAAAAAVDIHNATNNSQVLISPPLTSIVVDNLNRQADISGRSTSSYNVLVEGQGGDKGDNNEEKIVNPNVNAMNESLMEHDHIEIDESSPMGSESDGKQMPNLNNLAETLTTTSTASLVPISTNRCSANNYNGSDLSDKIASTSSGMTHGIDNNVGEGEGDIPLANVPSNCCNQHQETILSSINPLNSVRALHDNASTEEEQLMMNAAGIQSNYPLVLVRRLTQTDLNQTQINANDGDGDGDRVHGGGREERDSHELDLISVVSERNERGEDSAAEAATQRENPLRMSEREDNELDDDDNDDDDNDNDNEEMHDSDATPVYASDGVSLSSIMENDNVDDNDNDDNDDDGDESDSSQDATGRIVNNGDRHRALRSNNAYNMVYDPLRDLILRTRRSMNEEAASSSSSSTSNFDVAPRESFMQRFRRILFILSSRRQHLVRLGVTHPYTENAEGEGGNSGGGGAAVGTASGAEFDPDEDSSVMLQQIAHRLSLDSSVNLNDLQHDQSILSVLGLRINDVAESGGGEGGGTNAEEPDVLPENAIRFDTNLPAEHSYMGNNMNRVCGVNYLDVGQQYNNIMLFMHHALLFPGEILPFMISGSIISDDIDRQNGFLFGICFPFINDNTNSDNIYGVTCQIYEKGTDERGNTLIKSRALQRFVTKTTEFIGPLEYISDHPQMKCYGNVKILPDIYLPEPLKCIPMGSLSRFRDIEGMHEVYKRYQVAGLPWPAHIYEYHGIAAIIEKARTQLAQHKIDTMPTDPIQLSYWLVRNLHLSESLMHSIFLTNSVNVRLQLISRTFKEESIFSCRYCSSHIANCRELFAMSKHGVQTQYCNSAGYIHETNTLYQVNLNAILYSGSPSTKFSWFPGYQWHVIICKICKHHLGWEFRAVKPNLVPKQFYGISSSGIRIRSAQSVRDDARIRSIIRFHSARAMILEEGGSGSDSGSGGANADVPARAAVYNNDDNNAMQLGNETDADANVEEDDNNGGVDDANGGSNGGGLSSLD